MRLSAEISSSSHNSLLSINKYSTTFNTPNVVPATPARHPQAWVQPSNPDASPASKGWYAAPVTTGSDDGPSTPKGYRDAPPTSKGWYAAPATTGCNDDPLMPKGHRDVPPAIQGWYATAATTACDDDPAAKCEKKLKISNQQNLAQLAIKQKETYRHETFNGMSSS
jgi:hypothetical protein